MVKAGRYQYPYMMVVYRIENLLPLAARAHHLCLSEHSKLVGDGRHGRIERCRDVAYAKLAVHEGGHNSHAGGVAQNSEKIPQIAEQALVGHTGTGARDFLRSDAPILIGYLMYFLCFIHTFEYMFNCSSCQESDNNRIFNPSLYALAQGAR